MKMKNKNSITERIVVTFTKEQKNEREILFKKR